MQQGCLNTFGIHTEIDQNFCHGDRMRDIRIARSAHLSFMRLFRQLICLFDSFQIVGLAAFFYCLFQAVKRTCHPAAPFHIICDFNRFSSSDASRLIFCAAGKSAILKWRQCSAAVISFSLFSISNASIILQ